MATSVIIFWLEDGTSQHLACEEPDKLGQALRVAQELRARGLKHVTVSTDFEDSVGKPGVSEPAADYSWMKRRYPNDWEARV